MRIALVADLHGNALALETILDAILPLHPDRIISLGDQVNLGAESALVTKMLREVNAVQLRGNHERYVLSAKANDPAYAGANFESVRFCAERLTEEELALPMRYDAEGVTFCHALPEDDRFQVYDVQNALPELAKKHFDQPTTIVCGHGHNPVSYALPNLTLHDIGSSGCMDAGIPGTTRYTLATLEAGTIALEPFSITYPADELPARFIRSGMAEECPIMAKIACMQQMTNRECIVSFVRLATDISWTRGESVISRESWEQADEVYPWPDGTRALAYWKKQKARIGKK